MGTYIELCGIAEHMLQGHNKWKVCQYIVAVKISFKLIPEVPIDGFLDYIYG